MEETAPPKVTQEPTGLGGQLITVTQAEIDQSRFQDELMDNADLQPDKLLQACDTLGIKDLRGLRVEGMRPNRQLKSRPAPSPSLSTPW